MKKIKTSFDKNLFISYFIRIIITSVFSIILLSLLSSLIIYKLDADVSYTAYISIAIVLISSALTAYISVKPFKNNGFVLGALSVLPIIIFSLINMICGASVPLFFIKLVLSLLIGGLSGFLSIKNNKKIRIK